ncbi:hypothetical protein BUALT_Bualt02G0151900 [Buddleja alternifolia]|uniref:Dof-type domain-containing protein n=1 Tax=Buddleja alternifolia TaxID=168488 RepID=A0AAV6Y2I0_9LAMI|nr:hypothetical protein BUALT_Bualt02G0151900 [Buddleja alternifolia]
MKLFGRKIVFPENGGVLIDGEFSDESSDGSNCGGGGGVDSDSGMEVSRGDGSGEQNDEEKELQAEEDQAATELSEISPQVKEQDLGAAEESDSDENPETPSINEDVMSENDPKTENEQTDSTNGQQKTLKKPDKILPCPRCTSMDTKFCYYNNYNVNQPRHFCKSCQRYWTAGGTMRNVPVGAGRRKNKNSTSHCRHITISEALEASRGDAHNGFHNPTFKPNGTVLSFGPDSQLCESISSALNIADKRVLKNGCHENVDDTCNGSSTTTSNSMLDGGKNVPQEPVMQNLNGFPYPVPCIPGVPWTFPVPAICPPGYPMPFYPGPYWNCSMPNPWNVPWIPMPSPAPNQKATESNPKSPLGKHSRDGELLDQNNSETKTSESSIVVPKTLRIDDPEDAAKSSIWETLGIKYDSISREGLFKALQPKGKEKKPMVSASPVFYANPAALSRSINFHEGA